MVKIINHFKNACLEGAKMRREETIVHIVRNDAAGTKRFTEVVASKGSAVATFRMGGNIWRSNGTVESRGCEKDDGRRSAAGQSALEQRLSTLRSRFCGARDEEWSPPASCSIP